MIIKKYVFQYVIKCCKGCKCCQLFRYINLQLCSNIYHTQFDTKWRYHLSAWTWTKLSLFSEHLLQFNPPEPLWVWVCNIVWSSIQTELSPNKTIQTYHFVLRPITWWIIKKSCFTFDFDSALKLLSIMLSWDFVFIILLKSNYT